jgi:hypothetical protein
MEQPGLMDRAVLSDRMKFHHWWPISGPIINVHRTRLDGHLLGQVHIQDAIAVYRADFIGVDSTSNSEVSMVITDAVFLTEALAERRISIRNQASNLEHVSIDDEFDVI